jgi:hypothetical protein
MKDHLVGQVLATSQGKILKDVPPPFAQFGSDLDAVKMDVPLMPNS